MIRICRLIFFFLVAYVLPFPTISVGQTSDFDRVIREAEIAGLAVVSIQKGAIGESFYGGVRSTATNPPVTANTVFEAESLSKPIVAYIALRLVEQKLLDLDKPLAEYATYPDASADPRYLKITARMVLTHTSGFPNWRNNRPDLPVLFDPGIMFSYSGEGYVFLQRIMEHITFKSLEDLAISYVFEPLKMTSSSFIWQSTFASNVAVGHSDMSAALDKFTPQTPNAAFSLHTTAADYARFMLAMYNGEGLTRSQKKDFTSVQVSAGDGIFWGLGWGLQPPVHPCGIGVIIPAINRSPFYRPTDKKDL